MKWKRERTGLYTAGPYLVEETFAPRGERNWFASGPGLAENHPLKADAQAAVLEAALERIEGNGATCEVVIGDYAELADGRHGQLSAVMRSAPGGTSGVVPLYCFRLPRGRRTCVHRAEFKVVMP